MKQISSCRVAAAVLLILGLLGSASLLGLRLHTEQTDRAAAAAFSEEGLLLLAEHSTLSPEEWRSALSGAGVTLWQEGSAVYTDSGALAAVLPEGQHDPAVPAALIENHTRTGVFAPEGVDPALYGGPVVKALWLFDDYADRAEADDAREIEDLLFRAVTDRGQRLLLLRPFMADGEPVTDPEVYRSCLAGLRQRLEARGLTLGDGFSCTEITDPPVFLLMFAGFLPVCAGVWLVCRLFRLKKAALPLLLLGAAADAAAFLLLPELTQKVWMLAAAILFPCVLAVFLAENVREERALFARRSLPAATVIFAASVLGWSLLAGLSVAALMSTRPYLLCTMIFSGVKLALLTPLGFAFVLLFLAAAPALRKGGKKNLLWLVTALCAAAGVYLLMLLRSGDAGISGLESAFRTFLERTLYARPRTKELLIAVPCIPLFVLSCRRRFAPGAWIFGMGVTLECVSVVNTFCHAVAPLQVSLVRTLLSGLLGLLPGVVIAALFCIRKRKS